MLAFDWWVIGIALAGAVGFGLLVLFARGMSDRV
jgi:hypothetical protein